MSRAKYWSALLLAAMATSSGCGAPPTTEAAFKSANIKAGRMASRDAPVTPASSAAEPSLSFMQGNVVVDLTINNGSATLDQANQLAFLLLDEPLDLLKHYVEIPSPLVWDRTTRSFYLAQQNLAGGLTGSAASVFRQINNLIVIVDQAATHYTGTIVQFNGLDGYTVEEGGQAAIAQLNHMTVIQPSEDAPEADDFVAALRQSQAATATSGSLLQQSHDLLVYIDNIGRPHLYQWQAPVGKKGRLPRVR